MDNPLKNKQGWNFKTISAILGLLIVILGFSIATNQTINLEEFQEKSIRNQEQAICSKDMKEINKELERKTEVTKQCLDDRKEDSIQFELTIREFQNTIDDGYNDLNQTINGLYEDINSLSHNLDNYFSDCNC